jgi:DNA-binding transcriptional LysR family regulator
MRLRHIEVFNAVMLTGSVSGAARLINVTQPAVSRTLAHAEVQLGFALFQRHHNRLVPTAEALALYPHVEKVFGSLQEVQRLSATLKAGRGAQEIRVASILALGHEVLPRAVKLFAQRHPGVAVSIKTLHSPQMVSALLLREADVGFLYSPVAHPALALEPVGRTGMVCVAAHGVLGAATLRRGAVTLQELARLPVIGLDSTHALGLTLAQACQEAGVGLTSTITVQTYHAALSLARHGMGVALVDGCTALSADPAQVDVLPLQPAIPVSVEAARPASGAGSVAVRAFTRAVQQVLAQASAGSGAAPPAARAPRKRHA